MTDVQTRRGDEWEPDLSFDDAMERVLLAKLHEALLEWAATGYRDAAEVIDAVLAGEAPIGELLLDVAFRFPADLDDFTLRQLFAALRRLRDVLSVEAS